LKDTKITKDSASLIGYRMKVSKNENLKDNKNGKMVHMDFSLEMLKSKIHIAVHTNLTNQITKI